MCGKSTGFVTRKCLGCLGGLPLVLSSRDDRGSDRNAVGYSVHDRRHLLLSHAGRMYRY